MVEAEALYPFLPLLHKMPEAAFGSVSLPSGEKFLQKVSFPRLQKIKETIREKRCAPSPDY